jgi:small conductance mechanosensitive channel
LNLLNLEPSITASSIWHNFTIEPGLYVSRTGGAILVAIASLLVAHLLGNRVHRGLQRTSIGPNPTVLLARLTRTGVYLIALLWILGIFSVPFTALAAVVSIAAIAIGLSLQDLMKSVIAGIYLLVERPFHIGDEITISGVTGVIDDITMRVTFLHTDQGERIIMPNQTVFTQVIVNNTVAGQTAGELVLSFPRALDPADVRKRSLEALFGLPMVARKPAPELEPVGVSPDATRWNLTVWLTGSRNLSEIILALGRAFPEITIEPPP